MAGTIAIISSTEIRRRELDRFLQEIGAVITSDDVFDGYLSIKRGDIWVAIDNESPQFEGYRDLQTIRQKLGGEPRTNIVVEIGNAPESQRLAVEFACKFVARWPSVVDDLVNKVYSSEELLALCQLGGEFSYPA
jgi:CheY-like chemotaxis protein